MCGIAGTMLLMLTGTSPETIAVMSGPLPLYGTCVMLIFVCCLNSSPGEMAEITHACCAEAQLAGVRFSIADELRNVFTGSDGCTRRRAALLPMR